MDTDLLTKPLPTRKRVEERITFEQFCDLIDEDQKAHLINGVMIMESPASNIHEELFGFLYTTLRLYVLRKKLGIVRGSRTLIRFSEYSGAEPDFLFVSCANLHIVKSQYIDGSPDMIGEIVSSSTRYLDRGKKRKLYAKHGVKEYWLIDPYRQTTEFLYNHQGNWMPLPIDENGIFRSSAIPGFWLRVDWLFAEELPDGWEVVNLLIEGVKSSG
ncbi:MAG: Uma2 family endonuclease [candidate division KSB1 bacterium]|nr:Uma2 family endonuclease [candidate division KSB1 bacterium]MDZ7342382.1 Uma2 family endonuclease [candidate division KSB1 bacterium]